MAPILRQAERTDYTALNNFANSVSHIHRHLDWRDALEWLGRQPFWIQEEGRHITGALACPPEPAEVAWVRLFGSSTHLSPDRTWRGLFEHVLDHLRACRPVPAVVSLALREWYVDLLKSNGFHHHQDIVVFMFDGAPPEPPKIDPRITLREMVADDLEKVEVIDHLAFEAIWRLSPDDLRFASAKSSYCTVAEMDGEMIGYTMSSSSGVYAHLARLAVHPGLQRQHLGFALVQDLLEHFINRLDYWGVTLNTQNDNRASLALYHKIGFHETGERFPVFVYPV
ncbi:MAG: N-acetyltransferase [Chloroflexi bacterium]|nr:MAG: N-acetyltransferase [Chloroflexota bacterium]